MSDQYLTTGETRDEPSTPEEDAAFKDGIRQSCLAEGFDADTCELVADRAFNAPDGENELDNLTMRRAATAARDYLARLARICALYRAEALVAEFRRADLPLRDVGALLKNTVGSDAAITESGKDQVRAYMHATRYWKQHRSNTPC